MKFNFCAIVALSACSLSGEALWNGKDLAGWTCQPKELSQSHWSVSDEGIVGDNQDKKGSILWTDLEFGNFELNLDYRTSSPDYDSGIFVRGESHQVQIGVSRSLKVDLTGCIYAPKDGKGSYPAKSDKVAKVHKLGEWNHLRIVVEGKRMQTFLNGEAFVDYVGETIPEKGPIGLQVHAGVHQKMVFRNLEITELVAAKPAEASKPNVVIIYGDDVGYADLGCYGAEKIPTPNLDKLAAEGVRFTDAHCAAATCTPSRYSLLTGEMAFRKEGTGILAGNAKMAIDPEQFTLADTFQAGGYHTGVIGKWHLGLGDGKTPIDFNGEVKPGPLEIGFDYCFMLPSTNDRVPCVYLENHHIVNLDPEDPITVSYGKRIPDDVPGTKYPDGRDNPEAMTYYMNSHGHNQTVINGIGRIGMMKGGKSALWDDETMADVLVEKTGEFIARNKEKPFFLFFCSQDIHVPRTPHPRFRGKSDLSYRGDAMVQLDWTTGAIMEALEENGIADNTIVIFSSDNGPVYDDGYQDGTTVKTSSEEVDRGHDGSGPYRGGKYQIYEGGTRVPLIIRWPQGIEPGVSDALVTQVDFLKSFANHLEVEVPADAARDSRDYLDAFLGKDEQGAEVILEQAKSVAIRQGPWKFFTGEAVQFRPKGQKANPKEKTDEGQLFNVEKDLMEQNDLTEAESEKAAELRALLKKYRQSGLAE
ncbi:sulfatase-like hydrolase/transferase [Roseibacillus persicicus]|uniref:sulfatase-like hydrolase/transferase n=1 Tax=Roseibacillus persicicus TaxID=454148 RepID=UPI00398B0A86